MEACTVMRDLNLPIEIFKENILGLQMCGEDVLFGELPTASKSAFTKIYNQFNKSSIQATKKKKATPGEKHIFSGANFDPDIMSEPSDAGDSSDESEQENDVVATNVKGGAATKSKKQSATKAEPKAPAKSTKGAGRGRGRG